MKDAYHIVAFIIWKTTSYLTSSLRRWTKWKNTPHSYHLGIN